MNKTLHILVLGQIGGPACGPGVGGQQHQTGASPQVVTQIEELAIKLANQDHQPHIIATMTFNFITESYTFIVPVVSKYADAGK